MLLAYVGRPRESPLFSASVQGPGTLNAQSWSWTLVWMDSPESSMPVSLLSSCPSLCRLLPNLVDNLVNRVLANVLPDLVREGLCL